MSAPPCVCTGPESCGIVGVADGQSCGVCGKTGIMVQARCGAWRCRHIHTLDLAADFELGRRLTRQSPQRSGYVEPIVEAATATTVPAAVAVAAGPAPAPEGEDKPLRLLAALETTHAPTRKVGNILKPPTWCPALPGITGIVKVISGFAWKRPYKGEVVALDRNAAFLSAAASVRVAHGPLENTGPLPGFDRERAGYYLIEAYPWHFAKQLPNPLGSVKAGSKVWVPAPTVQLLVALAERDRWGDVEIYDSYTAPGVDLRRWTTWVRDLRTRIIEDHGRGSTEYADFKIAYSQAITLMIGAEDPGRGRKWKCRAHRPDWTHAVHAQASANLWRGADACLAAEVGPVAMVNVDEIHLPGEALALLVDAKRSPVRMDNTGTRLGTYKIKQAGR